ncbi:MAG: alpha/beta fold hydrolase [Nitrosopumilaceae archaeon]|jgi:class III poly(R)-hydroxyalkanoic acid synthase PhaC subunit
MQITEHKKKFNDIVSTNENFFLQWSNLCIQYNFAIYDAGLNAIKSLFNLQNEPTGTKKINNMIRATFDSSLRSCLDDEKFVKTLGNFLDGFSDMVKLTQHNLFHKIIDDWYSKMNVFIEPYRDTINRTPSKTIPMEGDFDLLHYESVDLKHKTPLLIVGSLINRHYILDLLPKISIVRHFQKNGFDVYSTDWRTPMSYDKDMTLENYVDQFLERAVEKIQEITGERKVSLFGYCWGGIFSIIYSAHHPENVKNLILHATPVDLTDSPTPIESWTKKLNADKLVESFGNIPGHLLNIAFLMRNPVEAILKYPRFFSEPRSWDEIRQFMAVETWLYDSRPIIGHVFSKIIDDVYKKNLLIKNKMKVGGNVVDLKKITVPFLNIVGTKDDLVPPQSSLPIIKEVGSTDKKSIEFPTGHVGLCISAKAHGQLWPQVTKWLAERSS